jgi:hypothetical protein
MNSKISVHDSKPNKSRREPKKSESITLTPTMAFVRVGRISKPLLGQRAALRADTKSIRTYHGDEGHFDPIAVMSENFRFGDGHYGSPVPTAPKTPC